MDKMKFIIPSIDKEKPELDMINQLRFSQDYFKWKNPDSEFEITEEYQVPSSSMKEYCPVGSVEFCQEVFKYSNLPYSKPINIPNCLMRFRKCQNNSFEGYRDGEKAFIKSTDVMKSELNDVYRIDNATKYIFRDGNFQISKYIEDIESEYRLFVYEGKIVGMKHYLGDPFVTPDEYVVRNFVDIISKSDENRIAYTLDVAVIRDNEVDDETIPIEMHDFFACGLYGFDDNEKYPWMLWRWWNEYKKRSRI